MKMAGEAVSSMIIFIAAITVAAGVGGLVVVTVDGIGQSIEDESDKVNKDLLSDITIISDSESDAIIEDDNITVLVKNTGLRTLTNDTNHIDVVVNGEFIPSDDLSVSFADPNDSTWAEGVVIELTINEPPQDDSDNRVQVIVEGAETTFNFYYNAN